MENLTSVYSSAIVLTNKFIKEFTEFFNEEIKSQFNDIYISSFDDYNHWRILPETFKDVKWPGHEQYGVYFIFVKNNNNEWRIYVGKATNNSISTRIASHIKTAKIKWHDKKLKSCNLDMVITYPIENKFLAPALEEYLIMRFNENNIMHLFNLAGSNGYDCVLESDKY